MDELSIPSTAIYGGSLARTFEYRTTGVHATPHLHWSFPLQEGATVSCPVLVAEDVAYVGDSAGFLSTLDAHSGDLLWRFATDWAQDVREYDWSSRERTDVTAVCLAGRLGYVASTPQTLSEVDLSNGQAIRSWDEEALGVSSYEEISSLLFYDQLVWFNDGESIFCLDPATGSIAPDLFLGRDPVIYRPPRGDCDVIYGSIMSDDHPPRTFNCFGAINLSLFGRSSPLDLAREDVPPERAILWSMIEEDGKEVIGGWYTVMDEMLFAVCYQRSLDGTRLPNELLALDPFTGAEYWRYSIPRGHIQLAAAYHLIFLVSRQGIEAVDTQTHQRRWKWTSNEDDRHVLIADESLFVLDKAGQITALDALTGEQRWNWQAEQQITGQFSTIADATLYLVMGHTLCALR